jgi:uncharacterized membrane protein
MRPHQREEAFMATIEKSIEINLPARTAYNQWTQFEEFPRFMEGVESVQQMGERRLHWRANVGGNVEEWDAEITEQIPDKRIAWQSTSGARNAGVVTFHRISDDKSKVMLQLDYQPETWAESLGDLLGFVTRRVSGDLERFKDFVEHRGQETGAWRGEIASPDDRPTQPKTVPSPTTRH